MNRQLTYLRGNNATDNPLWVKPDEHNKGIGFRSFHSTNSFYSTNSEIKFLLCGIFWLSLHEVANSFLDRLTYDC